MKRCCVVSTMSAQRHTEGLWCGCDDKKVDVSHKTCSNPWGKLTMKAATNNFMALLLFSCWNNHLFSHFCLSPARFCSLCTLLLLVCRSPSTNLHYCTQFFKAFCSPRNSNVSVTTNWSRRCTIRARGWPSTLTEYVFFTEKYATKRYKLMVTFLLRTSLTHFHFNDWYHPLIFHFYPHFEAIIIFFITPRLKSALWPRTSISDRWLMPWNLFQVVNMDCSKF